jgi:FMN-dependent NADH-azoreductase
MSKLYCTVELKKYLDSITIVGKTFKYTDKGAVGLLHDRERKAVILSTYGGFHFGQKEDFCAPYVEALIKFVGIGNVETIVADGLDAMPDKTASFIDAAKDKATALAASF